MEGLPTPPAEKEPESRGRRKRPRGRSLCYSLLPFVPRGSLNKTTLLLQQLEGVPENTRNRILATPYSEDWDEGRGQRGRGCTIEALENIRRGRMRKLELRISSQREKGRHSHNIRQKRRENGGIALSSIKLLVIQKNYQVDTIPKGIYLPLQSSKPD